MTMTEREAAIEWLENLTPSQRVERFRPAAVPPIEYLDSAILFVGLATVKDDHESDQVYCACNDPHAVMIA